MISKTISHYRILEKLGAGGMGEVYKAEDTRLHRMVALKVLRSGGGGRDDSPGRESKKRFLREAQAAAALNHPNIATIYAVEEFDEDGESVSFIAMEYVEGKPLSQYARERNLTVAEAIEIVLAIADALEAAHQRGIIHRDVKPANVMITRDRRVKVLDFGLAKFVRPEAKRASAAEAESASLRTTPGLVMGTLAYMSPEQARGEEVDCRSDIFSLGVVLYELLTGRMPFTGETTVALVDNLLHAEPLALNQFNPHITPDLERLTRRMLEKDRQRRYANLREVRRDLTASLRAKRFYEFGEFQMDVSERQLRRGAATIELKPKVFDLLVLLVQNAGRLLEKEQIFQSLWPDTIVEEANLNVSISALRKALGETASDPRYIETVPKRGYRFIASVTVKELAPPAAVEVMLETHRFTLPLGVAAPAPVEAGATLASAGALYARSARVKRAGRLRWLLVIVALLPLAGIAVWLWPRFTADSKPRSIAVLPFKMLARNDADQALALGMTDALITKLSGLPMLIVRPTSSVTKYAEANSDPLAAGRELAVEAVLDGRIQQAEKELRVTAQLIRVSDGATLWSGTINDYLTNIFQVQDSISEKMIAALEIRLSQQQEQRLTKRYTESTEAYQFFLQGQQQNDLGTPDGARRAIEYYQAAISKDPEYALAWARKAYAHLSLGEYEGAIRKEERLKCVTAAEEAQRLDPDLSEAYEVSVLPRLTTTWDWAAAEASIKRAIELNPNNTSAHEIYSELLVAQGRNDEALRESQTSLRLDPGSLVLMREHARALLDVGRSDEAEALARKVVALAPQLILAHRSLGGILNAQGKYDEAIAEFTYTADRGGLSNVPIGLGVAYARKGLRAEAERVIAERKKLLGRGGSNCFGLASIYAALGDKDQAFEWLEKSWRDQEVPIIFLKHDLLLESLRNDPRFADLVRRIGLRP